VRVLGLMFFGGLLFVITIDVGAAFFFVDSELGTVASGREQFFSFLEYAGELCIIVLRERAVFTSIIKNT